MSFSVFWRIVFLTSESFDSRPFVIIFRFIFDASVDVKFYDFFFQSAPNVYNMQMNGKDSWGDIGYITFYDYFFIFKEIIRNCDQV